jgi:hypothetical protein
MTVYDMITGDRVPIVVYDVTIENLEERIKKAKKYITIKKACAELGVGYNAMKTCIKNRGRIFSPLLNKEVAVRYEVRNQKTK